MGDESHLRLAALSQGARVLRGLGRAPGSPRCPLLRCLCSTDLPWACALGVRSQPRPVQRPWGWEAFLEEVAGVCLWLLSVRPASLKAVESGLFLPRWRGNCKAVLPRLPVSGLRGEAGPGWRAVAGLPPSQSSPLEEGKTRPRVGLQSLFSSPGRGPGRSPEPRPPHYEPCRAVGLQGWWRVSVGLCAECAVAAGGGWAGRALLSSSPSPFLRLHSELPGGGGGEVGP